MAKVSVIIPVYNVEKYIERCARSLFSQTLEDIEFLFIDDCTPDRSIEILKNVLDDYPKRKNQVVIHKMEVNSGQAKVREWGCKNASGDYIIHCDSDDWVDSEMYEILYKEAKQNDLDLVMCNYYVTDGNIVKIEKDMSRYVGMTTEDFFKGLITDEIHRSTCNKLIKKTVYQNDIVYPEFNMWEDVAIITQLAYYCKKVGYINKYLYYYYLTPSSISQQKTKEAQKKKLAQVVANVEIVQLFLMNKNIFNRYQNELLVMKLGALTYAKGLGRRVYSSIYPKDNVKILFCSNIPLIIRIGHLTRLLGIRK